MNNAFDFQKTYFLKAQSPMIHFQYNATGACLRATEVKPKLDRFLIRKFRQQKIDFSAWRCSKDHEALDYQMTLKAGTDHRGSLTINNFRIYYGNMGNNATKDIIFRDCSMNIICFNHELRVQIDKYIGEFFIVTNFGTMQDKGFGSFLVDGRNSSQSYISECLRNEYRAQKCYTFSAGDAVTAFKRIKSVYALMKSGINLPHRGYSRSLLFDYMHYEIKENGKEISIGNEKAWLKQRQIAPALGRRTNQHDNRSYYVRALLGIGDHVEFLDRHDKTKVSIKEDPVQGEVTLERFPSPILFKVIGDAVYYVGQRIHPDIYDKRFLFQSPMGQGYLSTPPLSLVKENFIDDFLDYCYYWFTDPDESPLAIFDDTQNISITEV